MRIQNMFRMQAIVIGLGAALMLAGATRAQEIENTRFDDGPNVTTFAQPTPASFVAARAAAVTPPPPAASSGLTANNPAITPETVLSLLAPVEDWMIAFLLLCIALFATYAISELRQARRHLNARMRAHLDRRIVLS